MADSEPLPKWMMRRYAQAWQLKKGESFTVEEMSEALKEDKKVLLVLLSNLRRKGWLDVEFDKEDARRRIYTLRSPEQVIGEMTA